MQSHVICKVNKSFRKLRHTLEFNRETMGKVGDLSESSVKAIELGRRQLTSRSARLYELRLGVAETSLLPGIDGRIELARFDQARWLRLKGRDRQNWTYVKEDLEFHRTLIDDLCENHIKLVKLLAHDMILAAYHLDAISNHNRVDAVVFEYIEAAFNIIHRHGLLPTIHELSESPAIKKQIDDLLELQKRGCIKLAERFGILQELTLLQAKISELQGCPSGVRDAERTAISMIVNNLLSTNNN